MFSRSHKECLKVLVFTILIALTLLVGTRLIQLKRANNTFDERVLYVEETPSSALIVKKSLDTSNVREDFNFSYPKLLEISKIDLKTNIEIAGKDESGLQSVPDTGTSVSWYKFGALPGQKGNAVLAGHSNISSGPAVFSRLNELSTGDILFLTDVNNTILSFEIYKKEIVSVEDFDVGKVYGKAEESNLNLVTCHGRYDNSKGTYTHRLILYSKPRI